MRAFSRASVGRDAARRLAERAVKRHGRNGAARRSRLRYALAVVKRRDFLRAHPDVATEYADLKRLLAREHRLDREAYTDAKRPFITRVLAFARR
jgi:GrpB-like predicted nucleotidyltransferase (UPF0157 family)